MPQPSSATTESEDKKECTHKGLEGEEIQLAKKGVIFQRTDIVGKEGDELVLDEILV